MHIGTDAGCMGMGDSPQGIMKAKTVFAVAVFAALACTAAENDARWEYLPPRDVDSKAATLDSPIPRRWSGQKAALAFSKILRTADRVTLSWEDAAPVRQAPKLKGDPRSLWKGRSPDKPPVTEPRLYAMGKDGRLFRDALPAANELMPFVVVVDGNPEDGYGGYVLAAKGGGEGWSFEKSGDTLSVAGVEVAAIRFDGTWLAGLQTVARARPDLFPQTGGMSPDLWVTVVSEWVQDDRRWNCAPEGWDEYLRRRFAARESLLADPRLKETLAKGILFNTRRPPTWNHCVAQYFGWRQRPGGSLLVLEEPGRSLKTRDLIAGRMPRGSYLEPRLSYDVSHVLFAFVETEGALDPYSMKVNEEGTDDHYYHLWTVGIDGTGLRQLTRGVYEDFMPEFLPDGDIAFMSSRRRSQSRCFWYGYSNRWQAYTMFRMKPDGSDIRQLSWNDVAEWFPTMANNGELLFARWDYIDRDAVRHQNLWSMRPDGTNPKAVWGNETPKPHCTFQPRAIPGSRKIACIASAHHACTGGPLLLIDPSVDENSEAAVTHVTPGHYPENDMKRPAEDDSPEAHNDWYNSPHPYGEDLFLVCWSRAPLQYEPSRPAPSDSLGLYVLAADGRREVLWRDGCLSACSPQPLVPRPVPPKLESQLDPALAARSEGEVFISNVYRGLTNAAPGSLGEVRVVQIFPRTAPDQYLPNMGRGGHENARAVLGTVPLEEDGSVRFIVPAGKPILFQVLDREGFAWRTMRSTTSLMPGERVSCVGCHESKREVSYGSVPGAMRRQARSLSPTPESGRPWGFVENVQPILDAKCVRCHGDANPPKGVSLTRTPDPRFGREPHVVEVGALQYSAPFTKSYATLCFTDEPTGYRPGAKYLEKGFLMWKVRMGRDRQGRPAPMVPCWVEYNQVQTTPEGPGVNALGSGLMGKLSRGKHGKMLTASEMRTFATWLDLNATFYGCYEEPCLTRQLNGEPVPMPERQ